MTDIPNHFTACTSFGKFRVKIENRDYISIGSKNFCVQIAYNFKTNIATLDWLGTEKGGCEITGKAIHGADTIKMTDLGFTILKKIYPGVNKEVQLRDSSSFRCDRPDGSIIPISNMIYNLLLHGQTYYQRHFSATPVHDKAKPAYDLFLAAWKRSLPPVEAQPFLIRDTEVDAIIQQIYSESRSWKEFFETIYKTHKRQTCLLIHSWYLDVYGILAEVPITTDWKIDISERPTIEFEITDKEESKNYTRKTYKYDPYNLAGGYIAQQGSFKDYLYKKSGNGKTRRQRRAHAKIETPASESSVL